MIPVATVVSVHVDCVFVCACRFQGENTIKKIYRKGYPECKLLILITPPPSLPFADGAYEATFAIAIAE